MADNQINMPANELWWNGRSKILYCVNRYTSDILLTLNPRIWAIFVSAKSDPVCHQLLRAPCTDSFENSSLRGEVLFLLPEGSVFDEIVFWSFFTLVNHDSIANRDRYRRLFLPFLTVFLLCFHQISIQISLRSPLMHQNTILPAEKRIQLPGLPKSNSGFWI